MKNDIKKKKHCNDCGTPVFLSDGNICGTCNSQNLIEREVCKSCERLLNLFRRCDSCPSEIISKCPFCKNRLLISSAKESSSDSSLENLNIIAVLDIVCGEIVLSLIEIARGKLKCIAKYSIENIKNFKNQDLYFFYNNQRSKICYLINMATENLVVKNVCDFLGQFFSRQIADKDLCLECFSILTDKKKCNACEAYFNSYQLECLECLIKAKSLEGNDIQYCKLCKLCGIDYPSFLGYCPDCNENIKINFVYKNCFSCGNDYPDSFSFCPNCFVLKICENCGEIHLTKEKYCEKCLG